MLASRAVRRTRLLHQIRTQCAHQFSPCIRRPISTVAGDSRPSVQIRTSGIAYRYVWYLFLLCTGAGAGLTLRSFATARMDPPAPGSEEDAVALDALAAQMDELDIVKKMRTHAASSDTGASADGLVQGEGGWLELDLQQNIAEVANDSVQRTRPLTQRALSGIQGLGVQRAFWNSETQELVAVIWIGPRLSGWPGIAHGGAIATIFEELMSRMIAGPTASIDSIPTPVSMSVTYARPTQSFNIYILRTSFSTPDLPQEEPPAEPAPAKSWLPSWKDLTKQRVSTAPQPSIEISGTLESLDGEVKVRAKGTWPASATVTGNV